MQGSHAIIAIVVGSVGGALMRTLLFTQPKNGRYGSYWHYFQHKWGNTHGRIGHVSCVDDEGNETKVFGLVGDTCGYVNVNRKLSKDNMVQDEIGGRSTVGFTWTKK